MITVEELKAAIAEMQGERHPNAQTCIKLAAYYTILNELQEKPDIGYSSAPAPVKETAEYYSETEFGQLIQDRPLNDVLAVVDELIAIISAIQPRLYDGVMRKLRDIKIL